MAQHDYNIADQTTPNYRQDHNDSLAAIQSRNSGSTPPSNTTPGMIWVDTSTDQVKQRNYDDTGWDVIQTLRPGTRIYSPTTTSFDIPNDDIMSEIFIRNDSSGGPLNVNLPDPHPGARITIIVDNVDDGSVRLQNIHYNMNIRKATYYISLVGTSDGWVPNYLIYDGGSEGRTALRVASDELVSLPASPGPDGGTLVYDSIDRGFYWTMSVHGDSKPILDSDGNILLEFDLDDPSPVNYVEIASSATGNSPTVRTNGADTDIGLSLDTKGTGLIDINGSTGVNSIVDSGGTDASKELVTRNYVDNNAGSSIDETSPITDTNGNELQSYSSTSSAVNHLEVSNAATGNGATLKSVGDDTDIDLNIETAGSGNLNLLTSGSGEVDIQTDSVLVQRDIKHRGDTDNKIRLETNNQQYNISGSTIVDLTSSGMQLGGSNARVDTIRDEDDLVSDDANALATQQSIKAYVDNSGGGDFELIDTTTADGVNSVTISDIFDDTTYYSYMILIQLGVTNASGVSDRSIGMQLETGGSSIVTSNYEYYLNERQTDEDTFEGASTGDSDIKIFSNVDDSNTNVNATTKITLTNPHNTTSSNKFLVIDGSGISDGDNPVWQAGMGYNGSISNSLTGFKVLSRGTGDLKSVTIKTYGLKT